MKAKGNEEEEQQEKTTVETGVGKPVQEEASEEVEVPSPNESAPNPTQDDKKSQVQDNAEGEETS